VALSNGAQGIGLCRTEHMFFATAQRIAAVRRMIAAVELHSPAADEALAELQKYQQTGGEALICTWCICRGGWLLVCAAVGSDTKRGQQPPQALRASLLC
jgi:hypothetical protein